MQQNELFDIVILGASTDGIALAEYIKAKKSDMKVAIVSKHFNFVKNTDKLLDTKLIQEESIFSSFNHGLIILTLKSGKLVVGKNLVIATGGSPIKSTTDKFKNNKNICYSPRDIMINPKNKPAVVYGNSSDAVNFALALSKKFKYVYLCSSTFELNCDARLIKKLNDTANIVHLPNCNITSSKNNKEGKLIEITLDTYDTINCSALILALGRKPCVSGVDPKIIEVDSDGYIKINTQHQTTRVPNIYAIGECTKHHTKRSITTVGNCLIQGGKL